MNKKKKFFFGEFHSCLSGTVIRYLARRVFFYCVRLGWRLGEVLCLIKEDLAFYEMVREDEIWSWAQRSQVSILVLQQEDYDLWFVIQRFKLYSVERMPWMQKYDTNTERKKEKTHCSTVHFKGSWRSSSVAHHGTRPFRPQSPSKTIPATRWV